MARLTEKRFWHTTFEEEHMKSIGNALALTATLAFIAYMVRSTGNGIWAWMILPCFSFAALGIAD